MNRLALAAALAMALAGVADGLENGLVRTPWQGWSAWEVFRCVHL